MNSERENFAWNAIADISGNASRGHTEFTTDTSLRQRAPESGVGLITGGSYMLVGGTVLLVTGSYVTATRADLAVAIVGGSAMTAAGATFIWLGSRRARWLRAWSDATGLRPPPDGHASLISGFVLSGGGAIGMLAYGLLSIGYCEENCFNPNLGAWFGTAGTALGTGLGLIVGGAVLRSCHRRWRAGAELRGPRVTPSFAFAARTLQFGVAGRF